MKADQYRVKLHFFAIDKLYKKTKKWKLFCTYSLIRILFWSISVAKFVIGSAFLARRKPIPMSMNLSDLNSKEYSSLFPTMLCYIAQTLCPLGRGELSRTVYGYIVLVRFWRIFGSHGYACSQIPIALLAIKQWETVDLLAKYLIVHIAKTRKSSFT